MDVGSGTIGDGQPLERMGMSVCPSSSRSDHAAARTGFPRFSLSTNPSDWILFLTLINRDYIYRLQQPVFDNLDEMRRKRAWRTFTFFWSYFTVRAHVTVCISGVQTNTLREINWNYRHDAKCSWNLSLSSSCLNCSFFIKLHVFASVDPYILPLIGWGYW